MTRDAIAAIDIGGTKIALGLSDAEGGEPVFHRFPTRLGDGPRRIMEAALAELEGMADARGARVVAAGVGCGGPLDRGRGLILSPPNLPGWDEFPVVRMVEERLGVPVLLDNDANAAALGEHEYGAGRGFRHLIYLTISTGIGGGIIIGGRLVHGVGDGAGEVGHMVVEPGGPPCPCGGQGCLEALCSGTSIARRAAEALSRGDVPSMLMREGGRPEDITARAVAAAAARGDRLAAGVWDETVRYLALGLSNIIAVLAPEAIILGGGVSTAGEQLLTPLRRLVRESVRIMPVGRVQILQAALGADSAVYGALLLGRAALSTSSRV
ncbi:MAG TPA: ROK family protein [Pyrinomonadaceae bacterium]|nr:ROK family protein [Pyrinomonadaceae bacterium]